MAENDYSEITDTDIKSIEPIDFFASPKYSEQKGQRAGEKQPKSEKQSAPVVTKPDPEVTKVIKDVEATLTEKKEDQEDGFKVGELDNLLNNFDRIKKYMARLEKQVTQLKEENKSLKDALNNSKCQLSEKKKVTETKK